MIDFSSAIQRRKKIPQYYPAPTFETTSYALGSGTGYKTSGGGLGPGDEDPWTNVSSKENPVDRYRRLRYEVEELEKEVGSSRNEAVPRNGQPGEGVREEEIPADLMMQLTALKGQLTSFDERAFLQREHVSSSWTIETKKMLDRLSSNNAASQTAGGKSQPESQTEGSGSGSSTQLADLDKRLANLEELIGVRDALVDEVSYKFQEVCCINEPISEWCFLFLLQTKTLPRPLLPSIARIEHLLTLLTHPRHLDGISRRIKILVSELERLHEARRKLANSGGNLQQLQIEGKATSSDASSQSAIIPIQTMQKLETVLPTLTKLEPLIPLVPALLARLHSLTALHASSNSFVENMNSLEASIKRSNDNTSELKDMLKNLEGSFVENQSRIEANLKVVESRMENITQRVEKLQG